MSNNKADREAFEAEYPLPDWLIYDDHDDKYKINVQATSALHHTNMIEGLNLHHIKLRVWQAAEAHCKADNDRLRGMMHGAIYEFKHMGNLGLKKLSGQVYLDAVKAVKKLEQALANTPSSEEGS